MKTLLTNCKIYDGTGAEGFTGGVLFENDRILSVGDADPAQAGRVIDLSGKSLFHRLLASCAGIVGKPSEGKSLTSLRSYFDRYLIGSTTDSSCLDFQ